jgi:hypothetical protein
MPWLPLAILLVAALTIAALALILFPPGEGRAQPAEDGIARESHNDPIAGEGTSDAIGAMAGANLSPSPPADTPHTVEHDEESQRDSEPSNGPPRRSEKSSIT